MTYQELLQDFANKIDRIRLELHNTANLKDCPFSAGHDMMLSVQRLADSASSLRRISKYSGTSNEIDFSKGTYREVTS